MCTIKDMPKKVDHEQRRRQMTDAVCRIALRGGLSAATFRAVAAEAGVSVRLVQHYFGTKDELLRYTQQHVGERSTARLMTWIDKTDGSPRAVLEAFLKSFIPVDEESTVAALMYIALYTESVVSVIDKDTPSRKTESSMMRAAVLEQLKAGSLNLHVDPETEATLITALVPGLGQYVLDQTMTVDEVRTVIDYHLDRIFAPTN